MEDAIELPRSAAAALRHPPEPYPRTRCSILRETACRHASLRPKLPAFPPTDAIPRIKHRRFPICRIDGKISESPSRHISPAIGRCRAENRNLRRKQSPYILQILVISGSIIPYNHLHPRPCMCHRLILACLEHENRETVQLQASPQPVIPHPHGMNTVIVIPAIQIQGYAVIILHRLVRPVKQDAPSYPPAGIQRRTAKTIFSRNGIHPDSLRHRFLRRIRLLDFARIQSGPDFQSVRPARFARKSLAATVQAGLRRILGENIDMLPVRNLHIRAPHAPSARIGIKIRRAAAQTYLVPEAFRAYRSLHHQDRLSLSQIDRHRLVA